MMTRILMIEDNEDNWISMTILLENGGFEVRLAKTGQEGVEQAVTERPDIILLDIQLPDISGYEVLRRLQDIEATKEIPVVAITSSAMPSDRQRLLASGCSGYIEKPIDPMRFVQQIKAFL